MELFSTKGFAATSTRKVSNLAGVSEGLIFHHFKTKADLLMGLVEDQPSLAGAVSQILKEKKDASAAECLQAIGDSFVHIQRKDARMFNMLLAESRTNDRLYEVFRDIMERTVEMLRVFLNGRKEAGEIRKELDTKAAAESFLSALIFFFLQNHHLEEELWIRESEAYFRHHLDLWLKGASA